MTYRVHVGTRNAAKTLALKEELANQNINNEIYCIDVNSGVKQQPRSIDESFCGARNRAQECFNDLADFSIGIEDGCYHQDNKLLNICCVCLWDGNEAFYASSSSFQLPPEVQSEIESHDIELSEGLIKCNLTSEIDIGAKGGAISLITRGQLVRKDYTRQALLNLFSTWKLHNDLP